MKKADILELIKYHFEKKDHEFRFKAMQIGDYFSSIGDYELQQYIYRYASEVDPGEIFTVQDYEEDASDKKDNKSIESLPLPIPIYEDLKGIINAIKNDVGVNKFLFVGEPGTGKTESAKMLAKILNRNLITINTASLIDSKLGQTSKNLMNLFDEINNDKKPEKKLVLIDEIDSIALDRINQNDLREMGRVSTTFFTELEKLNDKIVVIATTNMHQFLDKAITRRFDTTINFDRYTDDDKLDVANHILNFYFKKHKQLSRDSKLFKKVIFYNDAIPNPGELKNLIKISIAFSDMSTPKDYLKHILVRQNNGSLPSHIELNEKNFTLREIEFITGKSKSSVAREIGLLRHE